MINFAKNKSKITQAGVTNAPSNLGAITTSTDSNIKQFVPVLVETPEEWSPLLPLTMIDAYNHKTQKVEPVEITRKLAKKSYLKLPDPPNYSDNRYNHEMKTTYAPDGELGKNSEEGKKTGGYNTEDENMQDGNINADDKKGPSVLPKSKFFHRIYPP